MSKRNGTKKRGSYQGKREYVYSPAYQSWALQHRPMKPSQRKANA